MNPEDLERRLFRAARAERAPAHLRRGILGEAEQRSLRPAAAAERKHPWLFLGAFGAAAALAAGVALWIQRAPSESSTPRITAERLPATVSEAPPVASLEVPVQDPTAAPRPSAAVPNPERPLPSAAPKPATRELPEQLALLREARSALRAGSGDRALRLLEEYDRQPNRVDMIAEATLLRIEALASQGQRERAAALAERFVKTHPASPLVDRARSFTTAPEPADNRETGEPSPASAGIDPEDSKGEDGPTGKGEHEK